LQTNNEYNSIVNIYQVRKTFGDFPGKKESTKSVVHPIKSNMLKHILESIQILRDNMAVFHTNKSQQQDCQFHKLSRGNWSERKKNARTLPELSPHM